MYDRFNKILFFILLATVSFLSAQVVNDIKIIGIRVDFPIDDYDGTTGDGKFILNDDYLYCDKYTVDPPPHNKSYFESQLLAVDNYYRAVSKEQFGIDLDNSDIFPNGMNETYTMPNEMAYYHPLGADLDKDERDALHEERVTQLFYDAITLANQDNTVDFSQYDIVVVFHAGVGQDFNIALDTTPEDIPSMFIDQTMISKHINSGIIVDGKSINSGIILPETQNHILFPEMTEQFQNNGISDVCGLQFGMTGIFSMMIGQAMGLPPLWNTETGMSGVGVFGLMDHGSNNGNGLIPAPPTAWSRIFLGWEEAEIINPSSTVELIERSHGEILRVDINDSEYFLIENRTNWFRSKVDIDSARFEIYNRVDSLPNTIEIIFDSVGIVQDENGVIVSIPDYDSGLPGSGLLIWHIDGNIINNGINDISINNDPKIRGVDLEEAGGSQDMGFGSTALFRDPSIGEPYDMWYAGNPEYAEANNVDIADIIEFNTFTYPNTNSNRGSVSNISINNIGTASDTLLINISNNYTLPGFPDTSLNLLYHIDFNGDGKSELIGGTNELLWSETEGIDKKVFYHLPSDKNYFTITNTDNVKNLVVLSDLGDSLKTAWFKYNNGFSIDRIEIQKNEFDNIDHIVGNHFDSGMLTFSNNGQIIFNNYKNSQAVEITLLSDGGIKFEDNPNINNEIPFNYISAIDLNLDGKIEVLALDENGNIFAYNENGTYATGFPVDYNAVAPILAKNILGDPNPEIIFKNTEGELLILNYVGELIHRFSGSESSKLIMLGEHEGKNTVVSESNIWVFDEVIDDNGNEWTSWFGNEMNTQAIEIDYVNKINSNGKMFDKKKTYVYPNPIRSGNAKIRIFNHSAAQVEIKIFDAAGYFVDEFKEEFDVYDGPYEIDWDVSNIESGIYLLKVIVSMSGIQESTILKVGVIH